MRCRADRVPAVHRDLARALAARHAPVCTENSILVAYVTESPNVSGDDRSIMLLPDPVRLAVQVQEPT